MVPQALLALIACQNTPTSLVSVVLVSVVFVSVLSSEYGRQLGSNLQPCYHKPCLPLVCNCSVALLQYTLRIVMPGGSLVAVRSSLVVVEARSARFNSLGVTAGF